MSFGCPRSEVVPFRIVNQLNGTAVSHFGYSLWALVTAGLGHDGLLSCFSISVEPAFSLGQADLEQACEFAGSVGYMRGATLALTAQC
jgi:hypothetical protein